MKYYVTTDIHGYYSHFIKALTEAGYFNDPQPHKLIICGDLFDRGEEALKLQAFIVDLLTKNEVILIKGNHEDLALSLLYQWHLGSYKQSHHLYNGTLHTVFQLTGTDVNDLYNAPDYVGRSLKETPYIQQIIPAMVDYFETPNHVFVHGWIPCVAVNPGQCDSYYKVLDGDWRNADSDQWNKARWVNGMEAAHRGITEPEKTIVCGHWHCSFGHTRYEGSGSEFGCDANHQPYYNNDDRIIALDACTALSQQVNCIVIED